MSRAQIRAVLIVAALVGLLILAACGWHWRQQAKSTGTVPRALASPYDWPAWAGTEQPPQNIGVPLPVAWRGSHIAAPCMPYTQGYRSHRCYPASLGEDPDTLIRTSAQFEVNI